MPIYANVSPCPVSYNGVTFYPGVEVEVDFRVTSSILVEKRKPCCDSFVSNEAQKSKRQYRKRAKQETQSEQSNCLIHDSADKDSQIGNSENADNENMDESNTVE